MTLPQIARDATDAENGLWPRVKAALSPDGPYLWLVYLPLYGIIWIWSPPSAWDVWIAFAALPVFLVVYLAGHRHKGSTALIFVAALLALALGLGMVSKGNWSVIAVYAFAIAGAMRPPRLALLGVGLCLVVLCSFSLGFGLPWQVWVMGLFFGVIVAVANFFSAELVAKNAELRRSQEDVRIMAAAAERERIARDLHDLLGHTLTVVAVKSDLAARLIDIDPARAKAEMQDLQQTARTALADIREAVAGMRRVPLSAEVAQARNALAAVDTALSFRAPPQALPPPVEEALAMVLREGATNVVRHARASRCDAAVEIAGNAVRFTLSDDGIGGALREGNGIAGMRARIAALGGTLHLAAGQGTRIEVTLPLHGAAA
jgi:two-component system sensor histidine kinase DesK